MSLLYFRSLFFFLARYTFLLRCSICTQFYVLRSSHRNCRSLSLLQYFRVFFSSKSLVAMAVSMIFSTCIHFVRNSNFFLLLLAFLSLPRSILRAMLRHASRESRYSLFVQQSKHISINSCVVNRYWLQAYGLVFYSMLW